MNLCKREGFEFIYKSLFYHIDNNERDEVSKM
jgi:hypothetical protein